MRSNTKNHPSSPQSAGIHPPLPLHSKRVSIYIIILIVLALITIIPASAITGGETQDAGLVARIDKSLGSASEYLVSKQSSDGAWRSDTYGFFKNGPELTPFVLSSLFFQPQGGEEAKSSFLRGVEYLVKMVDSGGNIITGQQGLTFPVYTSAMASRVVVLASKDEQHRKAQSAWLSYLLKRRLGRDLGWDPEPDPEFGGWGFSLQIPQKPESGSAKGMLIESNLTSTIFGIAALRSAKIPENDPLYQEVLIFVKRCQNFPDDPAEADPEFDDGGFFFAPGDEVQNKAGLAGTDKFGRKRFHSYGTMTADGLRALVRCGAPKESPRVQAARAWLEWSFSVKDNPGSFEKDREVLRNATYYYYVWAVAHAFNSLDIDKIKTAGGEVRWPAALAEELLGRQNPDGSWINSRYTDAKEDDPLVSTPWAAAALALCRQRLTGKEYALFPREKTH